jgi:hypothetical protein
MRPGTPVIGFACLIGFNDGHPGSGLPIR